MGSRIGEDVNSDLR